jgi:phage host-nuclease inhibitor protein Gam
MELPWHGQEPWQSQNELSCQDGLLGETSVPSRRRSGGLWLMWSDDLQVHVHSSSFHIILATVTISTTSQKFGLVCIYGDPYHHQTSMIWDQVGAFVYDNYNLPMLCMGDMNELLYDMDKNSLNINRTRMNAFRAIVKNCGLFDLGFSGPAYTWTNKRFSSKPTYERLDRCLVNAEWCTNFPVSNVYNMPIIHSISDHAAILLSTDGPVRKIKRSFKFENWWLKECDFQSLAKTDWSSTANKSFNARTNHLAGTLRIWCRKKKPLQQELNSLDDQIKQIQMKPLQNQDQAQEESLVTRYEQTLTKLTESYMQRAKKQWVKDGDRNTSFFHRAIVKRRRRNTIVSVKDENDVLHFMPDRISNTFVNYFRSIFASSNTNHGRPFIHTQPLQESQDYTYTIPDEKEILETLKEMKRNASPGPDGFNVEFYIATWGWIGQDVVQLVRTFFQTGIMPAHINDTHIALIPKKLVPLVPADYRPISLCNVIYKIIAKCLANRLKPHLPDYIHQSQQAFIEGRRISNNIIIAQEITHSFALKSWKIFPSC